MKHLGKFCLAVQVLTLIAVVTHAEALRNERHWRHAAPARAEHPMARLKRVMLPLLRAANHPMPLKQIRITIVDESTLNAASAGNGQFYVTMGLLRLANNSQLRGVLAHEIAHEDLGHPMKARLLGAGMELGTALLEQIMPGSGAVAPLAGTLITGHYSRPMELAADRHAVGLLRRAGYSKAVLINTLAWLMRHDGDSCGGLFATHPATSERIQALQKLR